MANILITGGAGFIGSNLAYRLVEQGENVIVIDNLSRGKIENLPPEAKFYKLKVEDPSVSKIIKSQKIEYIFHLAAQAEVTKSMRDPVLDAESNIIGTINLLQSAMDSGVKKFIFSSSGGVIYGNTPKPVTEKKNPSPCSPYGISKFTAEKYIEFYGKEYGLRHTILRYTNVYGPRQDPFGESGVVAIFAENMLHNTLCTLYGYGKMERDYIYVKDVVDVTTLVIDKGDGEVFNIGTEVSTSVDKLFSLMKEITHYQLDPVYQPKRKGELDMNSLDCSKAKRLLDWKPKISLKQGLEQTVNWFRPPKR